MVVGCVGLNYINMCCCLQIKTLTEKVEYLQRMSFASLNSESLVESAGDREGSATKMRSVRGRTAVCMLRFS